MVMLAAIVSFASAATCTLASGIPFAVKCADGMSMAADSKCLVRCQREYAPTVAEITCSSLGVISPALGDFDCIPKPMPAFPWRASLCVTATPTSGAVVADDAVFTSGTEYRLTTATAGDSGEVKMGPVRTRGRYQGVELSFQYKVSATGAVGSGGDGFWAVITEAMPSQLTATPPAVDANAVIGVEVDLFEDAGDNDPDVPHTAVFFDSEDHSDADTGALNNMEYLWATPVKDDTYRQVKLLIEPIQTSAKVLVRVWHAGNLVNRDIMDNGAAAPNQLPTDVLNLVKLPKRIWASVYAGQEATTDVGLKHVQNFMLCGVEAPTRWHRYVRVGTTTARNCQEVDSFGNPDPTHPGVWKPLPCSTPAAPSRSPITPLAPLAAPNTEF